MHLAKKIKHILLLVFLVIALASCDRVCYEADEFYSKVFEVKANPKKEVVVGKSGTKISGTGTSSTTQNIFGTYDQNTGGQMSDWMDTGLIANGDYFSIAISGGWTDKGGFGDTASISALPSCRYCIKTTSGTGSSAIDNCLCGPILDNAKMKNLNSLNWDTPQFEDYKVNGDKTATDDKCYAFEEGVADYKIIPVPAGPSDPKRKTSSQISALIPAVKTDDPDYCTCKNPTSAQKTAIFENNRNGFFIFPLGTLPKSTIITNLVNSSATAVENKEELCAHKMGFGAYISLDGGSARPYNYAYHLVSPNKVFCPIRLDGEGRCKDASGIDRTKFIYNSPNKKIFAQDYNSDGAPKNFHGLGDKVRLIIYDQYFSDNSGSYKVEFLRGVISTREGGLIADIVRTIDGYIFGSSVYNKDTYVYTKQNDGVVEFMYKAVLNDKVVRAVISISLVMYVCFYGLAFFMGLVDYGKKEVAMRLLKIALVILFTNEKAWLFYNDFVIGFFKEGMDELVATITNIFESNMDRTLNAVIVSEEALLVQHDVGRKFMYIDNMILNLTSKAAVSKIIGLIFIPGKGVFGILYALAIFALIYYFISAMIDIALKYLINILKLCMGVALGPVFILFSLFEKTKDMFKNWLAFIGARSFEIIILFTMLHPFLLIIDQSFTEMLTFSVCSEDKTNGGMTYSIYKSQDLNRGLYEWFDFFIRIGALIFITKSIANQAGYISGQLITIGGVANADAITEVGRSEGGFRLASSMAQGIMGVAKSAVTSKYVGGVAAMAGRGIVKGATMGLRANIGSSGSINDIVNNAFKFVGIRNRGIRSYMRDRQVDNALSLAGQRAKDMGLVGTEKDAFVRQEAMTSLNQYISENPNKAMALGLDNHNIMKRFDQKLIKEPIKDFVKEKAAELKEQGIFGKEARDKIEASVQEWAKQNLPDYIPDRKISEFMKKPSVKNALKTNTEMGASEAKNYAVNLVKENRVEEAKQFVDKYRENAVSRELEKNKKYEASKIEGGKIVKGFVGGVNIASKALRPILLPIAYGGKKLYNWSPNITGRMGENKTIQGVVSRAGYGAAKIYNSAPNVTGKLLGWGEGKGLRAPKGDYEAYKKYYSDREWGEGKGLPKAPKGTYKDYKKAYSLNASKVVITNKITNKKIRKFFGQVDNVVGGMKDHVMGLKIPLINPNGSPSRNPRKNLRKFDRKIERELAGLFEQQEKYEEKLKKPEAYGILGINEDRKAEITEKKKKLDEVIGKLGIEKIDKIEKKPTLLPSILKIDKDNAIPVKIVKGLFRIPLTPLVTILDPIYKRLRKTEQGVVLKERHKVNKKQALENVAKKKIDLLNENIKKNFQERLVQEGGGKREVVDNDRDKIIDNRRNKDTDDIAIALREIEKRTKKEIKEEEKKYVEGKLDFSKRLHTFRTHYKSLEFLEDPQVKTALKEEREIFRAEFRNKLKSETDSQDTILERLIKREYEAGGKDFVLKYAQELAKTMDGLNMKKALFGKAGEILDNNAESTIFKIAFEKVVAVAVNVASDSVSTIDPNTVPTTDNVDSAKDDPKSNFDKNRKIATIIYDSIANEEFDNLNKPQFQIPVLDPNAEVIPTRRKKRRAVTEMETIGEGNESDESDN